MARGKTGAENKIFVEQREDGHFIVRDTMFERVAMSVVHDLGITYVSFSSTSSFSYMKCAIEAAEAAAKENQSSLLCIEGKLQYYHDGMFKRLQYTKLEDGSSWKRHHESAKWYKSLAKGAFSKILNKLIAIEETMSEIKLKDPTFMCRFKGRKIKVSEMNFYYQGAEETLSLLYRDRKLQFKFKNEVYPAQTPEQIKQSIHHIFSLVEKNMRIKNMFDPPKAWFNRCMSQINNRDMNEKMQQQLHADLMTRYSWEDIENYCYQTWNKRSTFTFFKMDYSDVILFHFWDQLYYVNKKGHIDRYDEYQLDDAFDRFLKETNDDHQKKLRKEMEKQFRKKDAI